MSTLHLTMKFPSNKRKIRKREEELREKREKEQKERRNNKKERIRKKIEKERTWKKRERKRKRRNFYQEGNGGSATQSNSHSPKRNQTYKGSSIFLQIIDSTP